MRYFSSNDRKFLQVMCQATLCLLIFCLSKAQAENGTVLEHERERLARIEFWQNNLKNPQMLIRKNAARHLGKLKAKQAVPALLQALQDSQSEVRGAAAKALGVVGDQNAIAYLKDQSTRDPDQVVRYQAKQAINNILQRQVLEEKAVATEPR